MESTCQRCDVAWNGDPTCWVCGRKPRPHLTRPRPDITVPRGAHSWSYDEEGEPELTRVADHAAAGVSVGRQGVEP